MVCLKNENSKKKSFLSKPKDSVFKNQLFPISLQLLNFQYLGFRLDKEMKNTSSRQHGSLELVHLSSDYESETVNNMSLTPSHGDIWEQFGVAGPAKMEVNCSAPSNWHDWVTNLRIVDGETTNLLSCVSMDIEQSLSQL